MSGKLKDYQVLDVLCGGTFYKVRHKVTNNIFAWRAFDCSTYSNEQIQNVVNEVKILRKVCSSTLLQYYDSILHVPSKTLYFVLEYNSWQSLEQLFELCSITDKHIAESFAWYLLRELAKVVKDVEALNILVLQRCVTPSSIFVGENCELRINCFDLGSAPSHGLMQQVGDVLFSLCYHRNTPDDKMKEFLYSDDLRDVVGFLTNERDESLRPDVVLYHPTVLANLETLAGPKHLSEILLSVHSAISTSEVNKCDSEKAVELCKAVEPLPRRLSLIESPIYSNVSPKRKEIEPSTSNRGSLSPTLAALALELPGFVPRSRKPFSQALETYKPQKVSEETLSQQWMSRLIALRHREESLNKRERELIAKEIVYSPGPGQAIKIIPLNESAVDPFNGGSNGITLPPELSQVDKKARQEWASRRRRRSGSVRTRSRRKTYGYEDLDSSLSADPGDSSMIITAAKFTKENMPRRNIFPEIASKKVHFTSTNPFAESDESVTLTFYELGSVDGDGYQVPRKDEKVLKDITKFKYLDLEKMTSEKRAAMQQNGHCSPNKQAKITKKIFTDITNTNEGLKRTPSKSSILSKGSVSSTRSVMSGNSLWSLDSGVSKSSEGAISERTRSSTRMSIAHTPVAPPEVKKSKRKSLLPFKTPFKFMTSTKI